MALFSQPEFQAITLGGRRQRRPIPQRHCRSNAGWGRKPQRHDLLRPYLEGAPRAARQRARLLAHHVCQPRARVRQLQFNPGLTLPAGPFRKTHFNIGIHAPHGLHDHVRTSFEKALRLRGADAVFQERTLVELPGALGHGGLPPVTRVGKQSVLEALPAVAQEEFVR